MTTSSYEVLALPAGVHARQIYFEKLVLNVPPGQKFGVVSSGLYCQSTEYLYWTTPAPTIVRDDDVRRTFNEILDKAGYPVTGRADVLFEDVSQIELIVAGLVVDFHVQPCDPSDFGTLFSPFFNEAATSVTGTTRINVKWQVYDLRKKQVVYETATEGVYAEPVKAIHTRLLMLRAFGKATEGLLAEEGFRKLITQEGPAHTKTM